MTKHTPIKRNGTHLFIQQNPGDKKFALAEVFRDVGAKQAEEYAAFIVRAYNCHDELVAALEKAEVALQDSGEYPHSLESTRAALAKAKGN